MLAPVRLPPGLPHTVTTGDSLPSEHDRSRIDVDRADRALIEQAAAQLRHGAIRAGYAGMEHKHLAFALALVLDELARHLRELHPDVRAQTLHGARTLLGE